MNVAVLGGGAAGFFAALSVKEHHPTAQVTIFEKSGKLLSKVKVSGGGRCNVTNGCTDIKTLAKAYPRGGNNLRKGLGVFNTSDTMKWFEDRGVALTTQPDGCVFPVSQSSQTVIDCFLDQAKKLGVKIVLLKGAKALSRSESGGICVHFKEEKQDFDKVIVATGGSPKRSGLQWLEEIELAVEEPVPSLFTFNMPNNPVTKLMGVVVENTLTTIQGTKLKSDGPLLITHWGMSGPSVLKLSAFGARILADMNYEFVLQVNWVAEKNNQAVLEKLRSLAAEFPKKQVSNIRPYYLKERLWHHLLAKCDIDLDKTWADLGTKSLNKIVAILTNDTYPVKGKTTFKEEFVTCGGVSRSGLDFNTMQSRIQPNLYFAGEVIDVDGITGGYNFQSAWTTGYIAGKLA